MHRASANKKPGRANAHRVILTKTLGRLIETGQEK